MRILTALLLFMTPVLGQAQGRYQSSVSIGSVDSVRSSALDEYRPYIVYTPPSYAASAGNPTRYPVLYLLDGDQHFHSVSGLVQFLGTGVNGSFAIPEMIVVAIPNTHRTRDLTPTHTTTEMDGTPAPRLRESGGNMAFFTFLTDELIPHIEAEYRTMPYRVLVGHSIGGITAINALYEIPETFDAYVAIDPSLFWDHETLLRKAKGYFGSARLEHKALYVAQANTSQPDDTVPNLHFSAITRFDAVMRAYDRSGIRYAFRYYPDDDHASVPLIAEYDALRFIFQRYSLPLQRALAEPAVLTEHFREVSERLSADFRPSPRMLEILIGLELQSDTAKAIEVAEIAMGFYPENARAPAFLGDVWAARGDAERARSYWQKALVLDPDNAEVLRKLKELGGRE